MHLIADHIGVFEDRGWDIQKFLSIANNEQSKYVTDETVYELTNDDILGISTNNTQIQSVLNNITTNNDINNNNSNLNMNTKTNNDENIK